MSPSLPEGIQQSLVDALEKLDEYKANPLLRAEVEKLKKPENIIQPNDHRRVISYVVALTNTFRKIETDKHKKDLIDLCKLAIESAPEPEAKRSSPRR